MSEYTFFSKDPAQWGEAFQSIWGCHDICQILKYFHATSITQSELFSLTSLKAWGDQKRFKRKVTIPPNLDWGMHSRGQSVWPLYNMGTPIPSQGTHHGGGS